MVLELAITEVDPTTMAVVVVSRAADRIRTRLNECLV